MVIYIPLHGPMFVPDEKEEIMKELEIWKERYLYFPRRDIQSMIDGLEYALDLKRRQEDV